MNRTYAAMEASAQTVIKLARERTYGKPYRIALSDFAESGGLCAYTPNGRPLYRMKTGTRTTDLFNAVESYA